MESFVDRLKASGTEHQNGIVTELGLDAFCFNWGVYGSLLVTGYIAITGKLNEQIVCRPTMSTDDQNLNDQIKNYKAIEGFTLQYCWATDDVTVFNETTSGSEKTFSSLAQDPRQIIDWLPRILVLCALLHLIPRIYWEQNVGHILKSYLSYMANLIQIIKGKCEKIPVNATWGGNSIPKAGIFDESSSTFDSDSPYELLTIKKHFLPGQNEDKKKIIHSKLSSQTKNFEDKFKKKMKNELRKRKSTSKSRSTGPNVPNDDIESQNFIQTDQNGNELESKVSNMDEKDLKMKLDHEFTDRHLFSQLCYRNFAHLPDMTFIESVQRVVTPGVRLGKQLYDPLFHTEMDGNFLDEKYAPYDAHEIYGLDKTEKEAANYDLMNNMGVLWSITKLFTCEKNFSGKKLLRIYKMRLGLTMAISIAPFIALLCWRIMFKFEEIVEIIRCLDEKDSQFKCLLPTAGDIIYLCWIYVILIEAPIFFISLYQLFRVEPAILDFFHIRIADRKSVV